MKTKFLLLLLLISSAIFGQSNTVTSGGQSSSPNGSVSYSVGQIFFNSTTLGNGSVIQGNQQPFEISVITGTRNVNIELKAQVYPNPVADQLVLSIRNSQLRNLSYVLTDMQGKILQAAVISNSITPIDMKLHSNGVYFIKVLEKQKSIKTFKIVKSI